MAQSLKIQTTQRYPRSDAVDELYRQSTLKPKPYEQFASRYVGAAELPLNKTQVVDSGCIMKMLGQAFIRKSTIYTMGDRDNAQMADSFSRALNAMKARGYRTFKATYLDAATLYVSGKDSERAVRKLSNNDVLLGFVSGTNTRRASAMCRRANAQGAHSLCITTQHLANCEVPLIVASDLHHVVAQMTTEYLSRYVRD